MSTKIPRGEPNQQLWTNVSFIYTIGLINIPGYFLPGTHLSTETKKTSQKLESKDTAANAGLKSDGILKSQKENVTR